MGGIGIALLVFVNKKSHVRPYMVVLQCEGFEAETRAQALLSQHTERCVVKSKSAQKGAVELHLEIRLKSDNTDFVNALADLPGVHSVVLVSCNGDYMGYTMSTSKYFDRVAAAVLVLGLLIAWRYKR